MQPPITGPNALILVTPVLPSLPPPGVSAISVDVISLPYAILADPGYIRLEVSLYGSTTVNSSPIAVTGPVHAQFTGSIAIDAIQGNSVITFIARGYDPAGLVLALATSWALGTTYTMGNWFVDENGYAQVITAVTGPTGGSLPTVFTPAGAANDIIGTVTTDGLASWTNVGLYQVSPVTKFIIMPVVSGSSIVIGPPSGISSYKAQVACRVEWLMPTFAGVVGTRVMLSTDPAGVNPPYVQYGDMVPVSAVSRVDTQAITSSTSTSYDPLTGIQVVTTTNQTQEFTYNYVDIPFNSLPQSLGGAIQFYAMLSTVVQDPTSYAVFESQQNGPVTCGFVNLSLVSPTDFLALQRKEDIAGRLITQMMMLYPNLDLTPRSEVRDLLVDPVSIELASMSVREWFARVGASISAISQVDDSNGDGVSDDFNGSPIKQQISRAFGLSANDTQTLINRQFDILGEEAGLPRSGAIASVVTLTFYTYVKPTSTVSFSTGILCSTVPDSTTPSLTFLTTGSAVVDINSSSYDPVNGWWGVSVPASCQSTGSNTNAGAGTIRTVSSGAPAGWNVTNLAAAQFGLDDEINSHYASRIAIRQITGVDSGTRGGYLTTALATPGVVAAQVVAAGDVEMLRDWDPIRQKHVFGCVDVYAQGTSTSEEDESVVYNYGTAGTPGVYSVSFSGLPLTLVSTAGTAIVFHIDNMAFQQLEWPLCQAVELQASSLGGTFYLGVVKAQFDNTGGSVLVNPAEMAYQVAGSGTTQAFTPFQISGSDATNLAAVTYAGGSVKYTLSARLRSPLSRVPAEQPVMSVNSVVGQTGYTGAVPGSLITLVHHSDFLLYGGSNEAGDEVQTSSTGATPITKTITASIPGGVPAPTFIDSGMSVAVDNSGNIGNILSVRSVDLSTLYRFSLPGQGGDYAIAASGPYGSYSLLPQVGGTLVNGTSYVVAYNKFVLSENLDFVSDEAQTLNGSTANTLDNQGFVRNTWLPFTYGTAFVNPVGNVVDGTTLVSDTDLISAAVPYDSRYVKVTFDGNVMLENIDFILDVNPVSGAATIQRNTATNGTSRIADGGLVLVSYFYNEAFTVATKFPSFVPLLANKIATYKHAAADVVVKAMVANPVDVTMTVILRPGITADVLDPQIRTAIDQVLDSAETTLYQSELVGKVQAITGVQSVELPLVKCAKSDGSYDIGVVIPTGTPWTPLRQDPVFASLPVPGNSFITTLPVLPDSTVPSGGPVDAFVGLLYQGQEYARTFSVQDFLNNATTPAALSESGSFYIIGSGDKIGGVPLNASYAQKIIITIPGVIASPSLKSYFVTYQVWGETTASDIILSSTEYITPGRITINYITSGN